MEHKARYRRAAALQPTPQPRRPMQRAHLPKAGAQPRQKAARALVLAGGGARGSYQVGVWRALQEVGWQPDIITGTSVGCLNGAMFVLDEYSTARDMWLSIRSQDVMELPAQPDAPAAWRQVLAQGGLDVSPLESIVDRVLDEQRLRAAPIRFGLVTVELQMPFLKPRKLTLPEIPAGQVKDYLMASAACFPALRPRQIDGKLYLDGGYTDNMPFRLARDMGASELLCVDVGGIGIMWPNLTGLPTTVVRSHWDLGDILHFDPDTARRNMELGYYDTLRAFGRVRGSAYAIQKQGSEKAAAVLSVRVDELLQRVRENYPATAAAAQLTMHLADMADKPLAALEMAAEEAGVDPTRYYTVQSLAEAFLAACPPGRQNELEALVEGTADLDAAARAAVSPGGLVQALVYRALAGTVA